MALLKEERLTKLRENAQIMEMMRQHTEQGGAVINPEDVLLESLTIIAGASAMKDPVAQMVHDYRQMREAKEKWKATETE